MGGNTPKGIYKHNVSYLSVPVNKYSMFSLDLLIQTLNFVMILISYAGGRCPSGILTLFYTCLWVLQIKFFICECFTALGHPNPTQNQNKQN